MLVVIIQFWGTILGTNYFLHPPPPVDCLKDSGRLDLALLRMRIAALYLQKRLTGAREILSGSNLRSVEVSSQKSCSCTVLILSILLNFLSKKVMVQIIH